MKNTFTSGFVAACLIVLIGSILMYAPISREKKKTKCKQCQIYEWYMTKAGENSEDIGEIR